MSINKDNVENSEENNISVPELQEVIKENDSDDSDDNIFSTPEPILIKSEYDLDESEEIYFSLSASEEDLRMLPQSVSNMIINDDMLPLPPSIESIMLNNFDDDDENFDEINILLPPPPPPVPNMIKHISNDGELSVEEGAQAICEPFYNIAETCSLTSVHVFPKCSIREAPSTSGILKRSKSATPSKIPIALGRAKSDTKIQGILKKKKSVRFDENVPAVTTAEIPILTFNDTEEGASNYANYANKESFYNVVNYAAYDKQILQSDFDTDLADYNEALELQKFYDNKLAESKALKSVDLLQNSDDTASIRGLIPADEFCTKCDHCKDSSYNMKNEFQFSTEDRIEAKELLNVIKLTKGKFNEESERQLFCERADTFFTIYNDKKEKKKSLEDDYIDLNPSLPNALPQWPTFDEYTEMDNELSNEKEKSPQNQQQKKNIKTTKKANIIKKKAE